MSQSIAQRVAKIDAWFDTIRAPSGYGGPIVHWWQNSLQFTGAGLDWRYEGIVQGYLNLYQKTQNKHWLEKAKRAADDLVRGQLPSGNFRFSAFEQNPHAGGTPHEAAVDVALLALAKTLIQESVDASVYISAARKNIENYYIQTLWNAEKRFFQDNPSDNNIVPNKAATLLEALFLLVEVTNEEYILQEYIYPTLQAIVAHQITAENELKGAIYQYSRNSHYQPWFFPYYAARCVPALIKGFQVFEEEQFLICAKEAMNFVHRYQYEDGSYAQIVYSTKQKNRYPQWIAGNGDILRAFRLLIPYGYQIDLTLPESWLLKHQHAHGPFHTAFGFNSQISQKNPHSKIPDLRDILPVAGWSDKAFRYLTEIYDGISDIPSIDTSSVDITLESQLRGIRVEYIEDHQKLIIRQKNKTLYEWYKHEAWAKIYTPLLLWK